MGPGGWRREAGSVIATMVAAGSSGRDHPNVLIRPEQPADTAGGVLLIVTRFAARRAEPDAAFATVRVGP